MAVPIFEMKGEPKPGRPGSNGDGVDQVARDAAGAAAAAAIGAKDLADDNVRRLGLAEPRVDANETQAETNRRTAAANARNLAQEALDRAAGDNARRLATEALQGEVDALEGRVERAEGNIETNEQDISALREDINNLGTGTGTIDQTARNSAEANRKAIAALPDSSENTRKIGENTTAIGNLRTELTTTTSRSRSNETTVGSHATAISNLMDAETTNEESIAEHTRQLNAINPKLTQVDDELSDLEDKIDALDTVSADDVVEVAGTVPGQFPGTTYTIRVAPGRPTSVGGVFLFTPILAGVSGNRLVRLSNGIFDPGQLFQNGFQPVITYEIVQGSSTIQSSRQVPDVSSYVELDFYAHLNIPVVLAWQAEARGTEYRFAPGFSNLDILYDGVLREPIKLLTDSLYRGDIDANARANMRQDAELETQRGEIMALADREDGRIDGVAAEAAQNTAKLALPPMQAIQRATVEDVETVTVDSTPLNMSLGLPTNTPPILFAEQYNSATAASRTYFTTVLSEADASGFYLVSLLNDDLRVALVNNQIVGYRFVPAVAEKAAVIDDVTRYMLRGHGSLQGTPTNPVLVALGRRQGTDILPAETTIDFYSNAPNNSQTLTLFAQAREDGLDVGTAVTRTMVWNSNTVVTFQIPTITGRVDVEFRQVGTSLRVRVTNTSANNNLAVNGGYAHIQASWVEEDVLITPAVPAVPRRFDPEILGASNGRSVVGLDLSGENVQIVTSYGVFDTNFGVPSTIFHANLQQINRELDIYMSEQSVAYTPEKITQLQSAVDGGADFAGLFMRTNHSDAVLKLDKQLSIKDHRDLNFIVKNSAHVLEFMVENPVIGDSGKFTYRFANNVTFTSFRVVTDQGVGSSEDPLFVVRFVATSSAFTSSTAPTDYVVLTGNIPVINGDLIGQGIAASADSFVLPRVTHPFLRMEILEVNPSTSADSPSLLVAYIGYRFSD